MSYNTKFKNRQATKTATAATGDVGTVVAGNTLTADIADGTMVAAEVTVVIQTGSVTLTPSWQVSLDNSSWLSYVPHNNAADVAISASATKVITLPAPPPFKHLRAIATVGGTTATAGDTVAIRYHYIKNVP